MISNKTDFPKIFDELKKYGLIFSTINYSPEIILDIVNNIKMICFGDYVVNNAKA